MSDIHVNGFCAKFILAAVLLKAETLQHEKKPWDRINIEKKLVNAFFSDEEVEASFPEILNSHMSSPGILENDGFDKNRKIICEIDEQNLIFKLDHDVIDWMEHTEIFYTVKSMYPVEGIVYLIQALVEREIKYLKDNPIFPESTISGLLESLENLYDDDDVVVPLAFSTDKKLDRCPLCGKGSFRTALYGLITKSPGPEYTLRGCCMGPFPVKCICSNCGLRLWGKPDAPYRLLLAKIRNKLKHVEDETHRLEEYLDENLERLLTKSKLKKDKNDPWA